MKTSSIPSTYQLPCNFRIVLGQSETAISDAMNCFLSSAIASVELLAEALGNSPNAGAAWGALYQMQLAGHCLVELDRIAAERQEATP